LISILQKRPKILNTMVRNDWKNGGKKWRTRVGWGGGRFIKGTIFSAGPSHGHVVKMVFTAGPIVVGLSGSGRRWEWNSLCISYFYAQSKGARLFSFFGLFSWFSISIASSPNMCNQVNMALFMWLSYHDTTTLHEDPLCHDMARGERAPLL